MVGGTHLCLVKVHNVSGETRSSLKKHLKNRYDGGQSANVQKINCFASNTSSSINIQRRKLNFLSGGQNAEPEQRPKGGAECRGSRRE